MSEEPSGYGPDDREERANDGPGGPGDSDDSDDDRIVPEPSSTRIRAGSPDPENVIFVVLGAIAMVLVILRLAAIGFGG